MDATYMNTCQTWHYESTRNKDAKSQEQRLCASKKQSSINHSFHSTTHEVPKHAPWPALCMYGSKSWQLRNGQIPSNSGLEVNWNSPERSEVELSITDRVDEYRTTTSNTGQALPIVDWECYMPDCVPYNEWGVEFRTTIH